MHVHWFAWLSILVALRAIVGALLALRDTAGSFDLTDEQLGRMRKRAVLQDARDERER